MFGSLGWQELLIVLVILALLFGASRVASLGDRKSTRLNSSH